MQKASIHVLRIYIILIGFFFVFKLQSHAQDASEKPYSDLFNINNPFEMDLIFDIKKFIKNKDTEEYVEAKIVYKNNEGMQMEKMVRIRPRGNLRKRICYLPPIKIAFDDKDYQIDLFDSFGKVKLVSTCKVAANHEQYVVKEYLAYKIYETLTEISFKTYFLKINFIDSEGKKKPFSSYSFILEDIDDLAERNNAIEVENQGLLPVHLDRPGMNLFAMYEYLISNVDWHIPNLHNVKLIKSLDHKRPLPIPVPYDLDYCGLVNTNYAIPQERIPIESLTERYYMGPCLLDTEYDDIIQKFSDQKEEILKIFQECEVLDKINKNISVKFLNQYFDLIEKGNHSRHTILQNCN